MRFKNQCGIITGGASGIGAAIATQLVREGGRAVVADVNDELGGALVARLGDSAIYVHCDVTDASHLEATVALAEKTFGCLNLLFNNAGIAHLPASATDLTLEDWRRVVAVDLDSVFFGSRAAIPAMRRWGGGAIVNIASLSGLAGDAGFGAYSAAKGAVVNYTRTLAIDHVQDNIRVNAVCPGLVESPLTQQLLDSSLREAWLQWVPMRRPGKPEEIAEVALFLASPASSFMTGSIVVADGGAFATTGQPDIGRFIRSSAGSEVIAGNIQK